MPSKSERTQQRIIDAANQLFYRKGYNRTSFTDVVEEAGVPRETSTTTSKPRKRCFAP